MASMDPKLEEVVNDQIIPTAKENASAILGYGGYLANPAGGSGKTRDELDTHFDAIASSQSYFESLRGGGIDGSIASKMAAKIQADLLGLLRREAIQSGTTRIQACFKEAQRLNRHGSPDGPWARSVLRAAGIYLGQPGAKL